MEVTWKSSGKGGFPTNVEHVRHEDTRKFVFFFTCLWISVYLVIVLASWAFSGEPVGEASAFASGAARGELARLPGDTFVFPGLVALVILCEVFYRLTHKRWLRSTISLYEAQVAARVREAADKLGFGRELPPLPENFPEMSNHELQVWCRSASAALQGQHRLAIRRQAGLRDHQARPAT